MVNQVSIGGYEVLEQLYEGSRTIIYRAVRDSDEKPVVIKLLKNPYPNFTELLQFRNQYTITKNLKFAKIIQSYSLEAYENGYALVMEDMGGISLKEYFMNLERLYISSENITSLQEFLQIAISLCDTLSFLYDHRIIHKDIKPANILINPETKEVKLIDFSIASLLPRETQTLINPNGLEGTLPYISPEQTGRMNRGIDYRSDFYSLGVTFYELLTGKLPFNSNDAMELVHCHIAQTPPSINSYQLSVAKKIPQVLSDIVMKLMAKNAEDRYQSAFGLKHDLEICFKQLKETSKIENFSIAQRDICERFIIPEKLYGREEEVKTLLKAFNRVGGVENRENNSTEKRSELMLVAGFSGIGKTAVVNEVHKPIVKQRGYFIKGKFDQFNRNIPLSAFVQAFRDLMGQLLSENDADLSNWKNKILQALGENGQVIIEVIPELERIIGKQAPASELSGTAAQNRFNLLFQKFIQVFTTKEHPLVVFLDDLQWADLASLKLMQLLLGESQTDYLLMIGAYRDNEVSPAHPLMLTLSEIAKAESIINTINLTPLSEKNLNQLVADTLNCSREIVRPLTELIYKKTKGNPFFSTQFLKALHEDGLIQFDSSHVSLAKGESQGGWICHISKVRDASLTDDVVEFMATQLQKLPPQTQEILQLAACIGNQFDLSTLAIISQQSETETANSIWSALNNGFILPQSEIYKFYIGEEQAVNQRRDYRIVNYKFLHDRVQQAAYYLIPEDQKQTTHYHIGKLLLEQISPQAREDRIFELVNQLNYGINLISEQKERDELAQFNLIACRKAKSATAYQAGREYGNIGLSLLGENAWQREYEMSLAFHDELAELTLLCADFEAMEKLIETVIQQANSLLEQVNVYLIRIQSNIFQNKLTQAIAIGRQFLQQLGVNFPEKPTQNDIQQTFAEISKLIRDREIEDLVHLPTMTDGKTIAIVQIANSIIVAAHMCGSSLFPLTVSLCIKLSIEYGNTSASVMPYICYGIIACNMQQNVETGVKFGHLALAVASQLDAKTAKPEALCAAGLFILHRELHIKETLSLQQEGYRTALEVGNLEFVGRNAYTFCFNSFWCGQPFATLEQEIGAYCNQLAQLNQLTAGNYCRICWQSILNLLGFAEHPSVLSGEALQEAEFLPQILKAHDLFGLFFFYIYKLMLGYLFGEIESAHFDAVEIRGYLMAGGGTVCEPVFYLYDSLTILAPLSPQSSEAAEKLQQVEQNQTQLQQQWARYAPMNYQHKFDLVEAEKCRVLGHKIEAIELYEKAISGAKANEYIQEEALANEL